MKNIKTPPNEGKYVVMFTSNHCPYCKEMEKVIAKIEKNYTEESISFYEINISQNPEIAEKYGIRSTPATFFMNAQKMVGHEIGAVSERAIEMQLSDLIKDGRFIKALKNLFGKKTEK
jgi:thioredoxin 1